MSGLPVLSVVFHADPKVTRQDGAVSADGDFAVFWRLVLQHGGVDEAQVGAASKLFLIVVHCLLDLYLQGGGRIVEPQHSSVHFCLLSALAGKPKL